MSSVRKLSIVGGGTTYYDAASTSNYRDFIDYLGGSEDYYFDSRTRAIAISRFRREVRNNPYLAGLYETFPGALGYGSCRARTNDREQNIKLDKFWNSYAKKVSIQGDTLRALTLMRHAEQLVAGELFLIKLRSGRVQVVPSEYCGSPLKPSNKNEVNGIIYNDAGVPIAYRFGKMQKTGVIEFDEQISTVVDAKYVIHDFRRDRVQMGRGIPNLISSLAPARDLYEITTAKTKQVKDASKVLATLESEDGPDSLSKLGADADGYMPDDEQTEGEIIDQKLDEAADQSRVIELVDGTVIHLNVNEKLNLLKSEYQATDYKELIFIMLHAIAAPPGLPVELWFSGLGDVNYSGFKGLGTQWHRRRRELIEDCEENFLMELHAWRMEKAFNDQDVVFIDDETFDNYAHKWAWQRTAVLDEERDSKTNKTKLDSGECCLTDIWEQNGLDPDEEYEKRRQQYLKMRKAAGLETEGEDASKIKVPFEYLHTGKLNSLPTQNSNSSPENPQST